jgi:hypothetical protein
MVSSIINFSENTKQVQQAGVHVYQSCTRGRACQSWHFMQDADARTYGTLRKRWR